MRAEAVSPADLKALGGSSNWQELAKQLVITVLFGAAQVLEGLLTPGELLVFLAYVARLYKPVRDLGRLSVRLSRAAVSVARIEEILAIQPDIEDAPDARRHGLGNGIEHDGLAARPWEPGAARRGGGRRGGGQDGQGVLGRVRHRVEHHHPQDREDDDDDQQRHEPHTGTLPSKDGTMSGNSPGFRTRAVHAGARPDPFRGSAPGIWSFAFPSPDIGIAWTTPARTLRR